VKQIFLLSLGVVSIVSGAAVAAALALSPARAGSTSMTGLMWEGVLLVIIGLSVLLNLRRIEAIRERYRKR
jgi:hypothetical protein